MKMKIDDVVFRKDLYPRFEPDLNKIQEYADNIERMPPILINQNNILIDGYHRLRAHQLLKLVEIEIVVEETESEEQLFLRSIETNSIHGLQLNMKEKKSIAVRLFDNSNSERLQKALSVSERTIRDWTSNKRKQMDEERNDKILSLYLKCMTQQQVAGEVGIPQQTVTRLLNGYDDGKGKHHTGLLEDLTQNGKCAEMGKDFKPFLYNIWNVNKINNQQQHFGNFPIEFMENLLYYYTKPFDVIYDPFAGGGVAIDACKKWNRRYYVSDLTPIELRKEDIHQHNIDDGLPKSLPTPDFVFLDPPYWRQAKEKYSDSSDDLGNMNIDDFYKSIEQLILLLKKKLNTGAVVSFIISPSQWCNNLVMEDHAHKIYNLFEKHGFKFEQRIICPYSTEQYNGNQVNIAKDKKIILTLYRDLLIFKR